MDSPPRVCSAIAGITDGFSFVYLQEAFISSLPVVANEQGETGKRTEEKAQSIDSNSLEFRLVLAGHEPASQYAAK